MERIGLKRHSQARLWAFSLATLHKLRHGTELLAIPRTQDFHGMNSLLATHSVLQWPDRIPAHVCLPYEADVIVWPHPPLLFLMGRTMHEHILIPGLHLPALFVSPVMYCDAADAQGVQRIMHDVPTILYLDASTRQETGVLVRGAYYWSLSKEHRRCITCVVL